MHANQKSHFGKLGQKEQQPFFLKNSQNSMIVPQKDRLLNPDIAVIKVMQLESGGEAKSVQTNKTHTNLNVNSNTVHQEVNIVHD